MKRKLRDSDVALWRSCCFDKLVEWDCYCSWGCNCCDISWQCSICNARYTHSDVARLKDKCKTLV
jgi:hypothetical protein